MERPTLLLTSVALGVVALMMITGPVRSAAAAGPTERTLAIEGPVRLPARLSLPAGSGPFPAVLLIHGSGPGDQDERIGEYRPFHDLAVGLARRGVAVLRYDKRTYVSPESPVRTVADEVVDDARAALRLLSTQKEVDARRIFLLGYDLGAYLVPRIAAGSSQKLAGAVLLGAAARPPWELHVEQVRHMLEANGSLSKDDRRKLKVEQAAVRRIQDGRLRQEDTVVLLGRPTPASYWLDLRPYDAVGAARELHAPLYLLFGERDELVTARDRELWQQGLAGRPATTIKTYAPLNHLFRVAAADGEFADLDRPGPIADEVVADIAGWMAGQR